jgi:hypothetical protein
MLVVDLEFQHYLLQKRFGGEITAVDSDSKSINILREKVNKLNLSNESLFELKEEKAGLREQVSQIGLMMNRERPA